MKEENKELKLPKQVITKAKYITYDKYGKELGRYRLKRTCYNMHGSKLARVERI